MFTTAVVSYPDIVHIDENKDFTDVINKALELGGYEKDTEFTGINGGKTVTTGFAHGTVLSVAGESTGFSFDVYFVLSEPKISNIFIIQLFE